MKLPNGVVRDFGWPERVDQEHIFIIVASVGFTLRKMLLGLHSYIPSMISVYTWLDCFSLQLMCEILSQTTITCPTPLKKQSWSLNPADSSHRTALSPLHYSGFHHSMFTYCPMQVIKTSYCYSYINRYIFLCVCTHT